MGKNKMFRIETYTGLNNTPAVALAMAGEVELARDGLSEPMLHLNWDDNAFVAFDGDGCAVGVMTWSKVDYVKQFFIKLGYVLPEHRGKGVYSALWSAAVEKATELKLVQVVGATSPRNARMQAIFAKQGRTVRSLTYNFEIPKEATRTEAVAAEAAVAA